MSFEAKITGPVTPPQVPNIQTQELKIGKTGKTIEAAPSVPAETATKQQDMVKKDEPVPVADAVQAKPDEAKPDESTPEQKDKKLDSQRFAALARREAKLQKMAEEIKARESSFQERETKMKEIESKYNAREEAIASALKNPMKALEMLGLSYEQITNAYLNGGEATPDMAAEALRREFEQYKKEQSDKIESDRKAREEAEAKSLEEEKQKLSEQEKAAITNFKSQIQDFVNANGETYEFITAAQAQNDGTMLVDEIYDLIDQNFQRTNKILSHKEACDLVESELERRILEVTKLKKFQAKVTPPSASKVENEPSPSGSQSRPSPTLSNQVASATPAKPSRPLTWAERVARANAAVDRLKR